MRAALVPTLSQQCPLIPQIDPQYLCVLNPEQAMNKSLWTTVSAMLKPIRERGCRFAVSQTIITF